MRIGVLTAGGDAAGLNAAVRALGRRALSDGHELFGVHNGWAGLVDEPDMSPLTRLSLSGVIAQGGTLLGSVRFDLDDPVGGRQEVLTNIAANFDALVAIGGDGTLTIARWLADHGAPVIGVPKTLDNDLSGTDYCIGFDTAVSIVSESLDRLHTTAASHHRVMVLETMGRATGWVAAMGGLAGGADFIVIPEYPSSIAEIVAHIQSRRAQGSAFSIVVIAEGVAPSDLGGTNLDSVEQDPVGHPNYASRGIGHFVAERIRLETGYETRATVLGYVQRGGTPTAHDRIWASYLGSASYDAVVASAWGQIPVVRGGAVVTVPLSEVTTSRRAVPRELYELCARFF